MNEEDFKDLLDYIGCDYIRYYYDDIFYCSHSNNFACKCKFESCPLQKTLIEAKEALDNFDPFFREEDYE